MKTIIILLSLTLTLTSCADKAIYISFYNIRKKPIDVSYSFDKHEYSINIEPHTNNTYKFNKGIRDIDRYPSTIEMYAVATIKDIAVNNTIIAPEFLKGCSFHRNMEVQCYNFIIDEKAIYHVYFYPFPYPEINAYRHGSEIDTINYWTLDFIKKNKKNYAIYSIKNKDIDCSRDFSKNRYWKKAITLNKVGCVK